jgi:dTDP-4-dehydrorhamnose reductase
MNYKINADGFEDYSVVDENGTIISEHISFAGHAEVLVNQLNWGMIKPEEVCVAKPDSRRPRKYLIFGSNGFLGSAFTKRIKNVDPTCSVIGISRQDYEFGKSSDAVLIAILKSHAVTCKQQEEILVVINCIGIADTRLCERNPKLAMEINAFFPKLLSESCNELNIKMVHISTGCLYDGTDIKKIETDFTETHCVYTVSKQVGEFYLNERDLILRPRLLFDWIDHKWNLITKLHRFEDYLDEYNSVTSLDTIIEATVELLKNKQSGVFNVCNTGWYTILQIAESMELVPKKIIKAEELRDSQGLYLVNNVMSVDKLKQFYYPRDIILEINRCNEITQDHFNKYEAMRYQC